jgi:(2Fe-2S) ferredoxin
MIARLTWEYFLVLATTIKIHTTHKVKMSNSNKYRVFICTKRSTGSCCFDCGGIEIYQAFLDEIKQRQLENKVQICQSGCLDHCKEGAIALVSQVKIYEPSWLPTKIQKRILSNRHWYSRLNIIDIPEIVESHFMNGELLERKSFYD